MHQLATKSALVVLNVCDLNVKDPVSEAMLLDATIRNAAVAERVNENFKIWLLKVKRKP